MRLGNVQGLLEKFQILISLMEFIETLFHCVRRKSPQFLQKLSFHKNLAEKPKSSVFEMISGFCSSLLLDIISTYQIVKFHFIFSLE